MSQVDKVDYVLILDRSLSLVTVVVAGAGIIVTGGRDG